MSTPVSAPKGLQDLKYEETKHIDSSSSLNYSSIVDNVVSRANSDNQSRQVEMDNIEVPSHLSPRSRRKFKNRFYCQQNRRKKKEYVRELEQKVDRLERQIVQLNNQVEKLQYKINITAIGAEPDLAEFKQLQSYSTATAIKSLNETKDMMQLRNKIKEVSKFTGCASQNRRKLIKAAIRVVIDNIVPSRVRVLFGVCEEESKATEEQIHKLFTMDEKNREMEAQKPIYSSIDRLHLHMQMEPEVHLQVRKRLDEFVKIKKDFERSIHDLIRARNRILNHQLDFTKLDNPSKLGFTPANVIKFYEATKKMESEERFDIWNTFSITKSEPKSNNIPDYIDEDSIEISDIENVSSFNSNDGNDDNDR